MGVNGFLTGLARAGVQGAAGTAQGQLLGMEERNQREMALAQLARETALSEAQGRKEDAQADYWKGRNKEQADAAAARAAAIQQRTDELKQQHAEALAQKTAEDNYRASNDSANRQALIERARIMASTRGTENDPAVQERKYIMQRVAKLMAPTRDPLNPLGQKPGMDAASAVKQARAEWQQITNQPSAPPDQGAGGITPPVGPKMPSPAMVQAYHKELSGVLANHAKALQNGYPEDQVNTAMGQQLGSLHQKYGMPGPAASSVSTAPVVPTAPRPIAGVAPAPGAPQQGMPQPPPRPPQAAPVAPAIPPNRPVLMDDETDDDEDTTEGTP